MGKRLWCGLLWILLPVLAAGAAGVREGMTREQVEAELGRPLSALTRGEVVVLRYPGDGRVELTGDRVVRVVRVRHADDPPTAAEAAAAEAAAEAKAEAEAEAKYAAENAREQAEWAKADGEARRKLEETVEQLTAEHEAGPTAADAGLEATTSREFWIGLLAAVLVKTAVGVVVLKLAFKWADVHADWGQMVLPSAVAALAGATVCGVGYAAWHATEFFRVDDAVSYLALMGMLMKTTHACTWRRALEVAAAAKLMSIAVWVFLSVAITRVLFG